MSALSAVGSVPVPNAAIPPPRPGADAGSVGHNGGALSGFLNDIGGRLKQALPWAAIGAAAGAMVPIIPGGPLGGALIGGGLGLIGGGGKIGKTLLGAGAGAILGTLLPIIPGGPIGGALIGAGLSYLF